MKEKWKDIFGYEGLYEISSHGRVRSSHADKSLILKLRKNRHGYIIVTLSKDSVLKTKQVGRVLALHFIPNPGQLPLVNHIDEDKTNNTVSNLEWMTHKENTNHGGGIERGAIPRRKYIAKLDRHTGEVISIHHGIKTAADEHNFEVSCISKCCRDDSRTAYGFKWRYSNEKEYKLLNIKSTEEEI